MCVNSSNDIKQKKNLLKQKLKKFELNKIIQNLSKKLHLVFEQACKFGDDPNLNQKLKRKILSKNEYHGQKVRKFKKIDDNREYIYLTNKCKLKLGDNNEFKFNIQQNQTNKF